MEENYQLAKNKKLITLDKSDRILLTEEGKKLVEVSYIENLHTSHWMGIFFSARTVLIGSAIVLIILSLLKIFTGLQLGSQGMLTEGIENLTDFVKIGIVGIIGLKFRKDRLASLMIIILMMVTGAMMVWSGIEALFNPNTITPTVQAFFISILSIALNLGMGFLKSMVGRSSGNLAFLSDSKDSLFNVKISIGVLIGLIFSIFGYYFVDAIVGIIIACLVFKEGIEIIIELRKKEENFDITNIRVVADNIYESRITAYILGSIRRESLTRDELFDNFEKGLKLGREYFEGFADFFYSDLGREIMEKHLNKLIEGKYLEEKQDTELMLTPKGLKAFYKAKIREYRERSDQIKIKIKFRWRYLTTFIIIAIIILVFTFADEINAFFSNLH